MAINKIKISQLELENDLEGLFTIGINGANKSVRVSLAFIKENADKVKAAEIAATNANNAASKATQSASDADNAKTSANNAADTANIAATNANSEIIAMEKLKEEIIALYKLQPTSMVLTYPKKITLGNNEYKKIEFQLYPIDALQNCLFLGDDKAVSVMPDGYLTVNKLGISSIKVIPPENTKIYKIIQIEVIAPKARITNSGGWRLTEDGKLRTT